MCLAGFLLLATDVFSELFPSRQFLEEGRKPAMVEWLRHVRRTLHKFPELKWEEEQTSALIRQELDVQVPRCKAWRRCNLGNSEAPVVALRADMDAFPIQGHIKRPNRSMPGLAPARQRPPFAPPSAHRHQPCEQPQHWRQQGVPLQE